jgi:hypothetical protein
VIANHLFKKLCDVSRKVFPHNIVDTLESVKNSRLSFTQIANYLILHVSFMLLILISFSYLSPNNDYAKLSKLQLEMLSSLSYTFAGKDYFFYFEKIPSIKVNFFCCFKCSRAFQFRSNDHCVAHTTFVVKIIISQMFTSWKKW